MNVTRSYSVDFELVQLLDAEPNKSELICDLLKKYYAKEIPSKELLEKYQKALQDYLTLSEGNKLSFEEVEALIVKGKKYGDVLSKIKEQSGDLTKHFSKEVLSLFDLEFKDQQMKQESLEDAESILNASMK